MRHPRGDRVLRLLLFLLRENRQVYWAHEIRPRFYARFSNRPALRTFARDRRTLEAMGFQFAREFWMGSNGNISYAINHDIYQPRGDIASYHRILAASLRLPTAPWELRTALAKLALAAGERPIPLPHPSPGGSYFVSARLSGLLTALAVIARYPDEFTAVELARLFGRSSRAPFPLASLNLISRPPAGPDDYFDVSDSGRCRAYSPLYFGRPLRLSPSEQTYIDAAERLARRPSLGIQIAP